MSILASATTLPGCIFVSLDRPLPGKVDGRVADASSLDSGTTPSSSESPEHESSVLPPSTYEGDGMVGPPDGGATGSRDAATQSTPQAVLGEPCTVGEQVACIGAAQEHRLICRKAVWASHESCIPGEHCAQRTGECVAVPVACQGAEADKSYCEGRTRKVCGEDLVGFTIEHCASDCVNDHGRATCKRVVCGDGVPEGVEACDDGNTITETAATACGYGETRDDLCNADCTEQLHLVGPYCGDNTIDGPEACDTAAAWCKQCRVRSVIATGERHTCVLSSEGAVRCWGYGALGQLGNGSYSDLTEPTTVSGMETGATAISAGGQHTCAVASDGALRCWGSGGSGQLGTGFEYTEAEPVNVLGLESGVLEVSAGGTHSCAVSFAGAATCWGANSNGQLGRGLAAEFADGGVDAGGTLRDGFQPGLVARLDAGVIAIASGRQHTCAVTFTGEVKCWGSGFSGQLGVGSNVDQYEPVSVSGLSSGVVGVSAGGSHTCAVTSEGAVKCWGFGGAGQLGNGSTANQWQPVSVTGLSSGVVAVSAGSDHTCALTSEGAVNCWGSGNAGQLGNGSYARQTEPVTALGLSSGVVALSAGGQHTCAMTSDGVVMCWGDGLFGQLGSDVDTSNIPLAVGSVVDDAGSGADVNHDAN